VAAGQRGFSRTRLVCHMEWALEDHEGASDLKRFCCGWRRIRR
jgi:hypothetical protein